MLGLADALGARLTLACPPPHAPTTNAQHREHGCQVSVVGSGLAAAEGFSLAGGLGGGIGGQPAQRAAASASASAADSFDGFDVDEFLAKANTADLDAEEHQALEKLTETALEAASNISQLARRRRGSHAL